jgi:hypothetical protein
MAALSRLSRPRSGTAIKRACKNTGIRRCLACNSENQVATAANGGISAIVKAMTLHLAQTDVQKQGCWALCNLTCSGDSRRTIANAGGISAIVHAMRRLGDHVGVQKSGCTALSNLACNGGNKVTIAAKGGIEAIVNAMQRHGANAGVKKHGDLALKNLAECNPKNRALIANAQVAAQKLS